MRAARQVDVVLQNHTQELLTIEGGINIQGDWNPALGPPKIGSVVAKQGSVKWSTIALEANAPCEANVRLGCTKGYIEVHWLLPFAAERFEMLNNAPTGLEIAHRVGGPNYDYRVVLVTLTAKPKPA